MEPIKLVSRRPTVYLYIYIFTYIFSNIFHRFSRQSIFRYVALIKHSSATFAYVSRGGARRSAPVARRDPVPGLVAAWRAPSAASASPSVRPPVSSALHGPPGAAPSGCSTDQSCPLAGALSLPGCLEYLCEEEK